MTQKIYAHLENVLFWLARPIAVPETSLELLTVTIGHRVSLLWY